MLVFSAIGGPAARRHSLMPRRSWARCPRRLSVARTLGPIGQSAMTEDRANFYRMRTWQAPYTRCRQVNSAGMCRVPARRPLFGNMTAGEWSPMTPLISSGRFIGRCLRLEDGGASESRFAPIAHPTWIAHCRSRCALFARRTLAQTLTTSREGTDWFGSPGAIPPLKCTGSFQVPEYRLHGASGCRQARWQARPALAANQSDFDLLTAGLNGDHGCEALAG